VEPLKPVVTWRIGKRKSKGAGTTSREGGKVSISQTNGEKIDRGRKGNKEKVVGSMARPGTSQKGGGGGNKVGRNSVKRKVPSNPSIKKGRALSRPGQRTKIPVLSVKTQTQPRRSTNGRPKGGKSLRD